MSKVPRHYRPHDQSREIELDGVRLASFRRRLGAFVIDMTVITILFMTGVLVVGVWLADLGIIDLKESNNLSLGFDNWYSVLLIALYFSLSHYYWKGRTLGKRILHLRVLSLKHDHLHFWHCVERALGYGASALEAGLGFFQVIWKSDRRATHDRIAETIVIDERPLQSSSPEIK